MSLGVTWVPYAQLHLWYCFHPYFSKHKWRGSWADVFAICFSIWHRFAALPSSSSSRHHCNFSKVEHQLLKHHRKQPRLSKLSSMNPWSSTIIIATNRIAFKQPKNLNLYHKHKPTHIQRFHKGAQSRLIRNWSRIKPNFIQATRSRRLAIGARKPSLKPSSREFGRDFFSDPIQRAANQVSTSKSMAMAKSDKRLPKTKAEFYFGRIELYCRIHKVAFHLFDGRARSMFEIFWRDWWCQDSIEWLELVNVWCSYKWRGLVMCFLVVLLVSDCAPRLLSWWLYVCVPGDATIEISPSLY